MKLKTEIPKEQLKQLQAIEAAILQTYGCTAIDLRNSRHRQTGTLYRQIFCYLAKRYTCVSFSRIGFYIGLSDHTSVMAAVDTIQNRLDTEDVLVKGVPALEAQFHQKYTIPAKAPKPDNHMGYNMQVLREQRGWSIKEVAATLEIGQQTLVQYEAGKYLPSLEVFTRICELYNIQNWRSFTTRKLKWVGFRLDKKCA